MPASRCGDCGAPAEMEGPPGTGLVKQHFPDCPTLQEQAAGVEVVATASHTSPRRCPKCGSAMTRNHDQGSDTWTDNCTGGVCGVTVEVSLEEAAATVPDPISPAAAFAAIASMPGAQVLEIPYPGEGELCSSCGQVVIPEHVLTVQYGERFYHLNPCWKEAKAKL